MHEFLTVHLPAFLAGTTLAIVVFQIFGDSFIVRRLNGRYLGKDIFEAFEKRLAAESTALWSAMGTVKDVARDSVGTESKSVWRELERLSSSLDQIVQDHAHLLAMADAVAEIGRQQSEAMAILTAFSAHLENYHGRHD